MIYNDAKVSLRDLKKIKPPRHDDAGAYWTPIDYGQLLDTLETEADRRGLLLPEPRIGLAHGGAEMAASYAVGLKKPSVPGVELCIGVVTGNSRHRSTKFFAGAVVPSLACGYVHAEFKARKHAKRVDGKLDLEAIVQQGLDEWKEAIANIPAEVAELKSRTLTDEEASALVMEAARLPARWYRIAWGKVKLVDAHYRDPKHKEMRPRTAWSLLMAYSQVVKEENPVLQMGKLLRFKELLLTKVAA